MVSWWDIVWASAMLAMSCYILRCTFIINRNTHEMQENLHEMRRIRSGHSREE